MNGNDLTALPADVFDKLTALTTLDLARNDLTALPADVFDQLTVLEWLSLSGNDLTALPADVFDQLTVLEWLSLSGNDLTALPADVFDQLTALTELYLFGNDLTALPADVFDQLTALTTLHLSGNDLTALPADVFDQLTALTTLYLSGNDLTTLPAGIFDQLTALTELNLYGNDLTTLPAGIFDQLTALTTLNLSGNDLTALPADVFENLTALLRNGLDFSNNPGTSTFTPVANAGEDATATTGAAVSLSGSSTGPWGNNVTWSWTQVTSAGFIYNDDDVRQLTGRDTPSPSFTATPTAHYLYFRLTVTARGILTIFTSDTVKVTVTATSNQVAAPSITGTAILPELGNGSWGEGETIETALTFDEAVTVDTTGGIPSVQLTLGASTEKAAPYIRGSGTTELVFGYTLAKDEGPYDSALLTLNSLALNGGAIRSTESGADAALAHDGFAVIGGPTSRGVAEPGPTARFSALPERHDGESAFDIELHFSAAPEGLSYRTVGGGLLAVTGGTVQKARAQDDGQQHRLGRDDPPGRTRRHRDPAAGARLRRGERGLLRQPPARGGSDGGGAGRSVYGLVLGCAGGA